MMRSVRRSGVALAALIVVGCDERAMHRGAPTSAAASVSTSSSSNERCLSIVSWNDMHGSLEPDLALVDTGRVPAGGIVAVADEVSRIRGENEPVVVLDAGDEWTGPLESTLAEGEPMVLAYDAIGVDAAALGNHDFDFGPVGYDKVIAAVPAPLEGEESADGPRGALLARMAQASYPYLSANVRKSGGASPTWKNFHPSAIVTQGEFRVGVVGYTTKETPNTTLKPNVADLDFTGNSGKFVADAIRDLRAAGASPIVLLAHASMEGELPQSLDEPNDAQGVKHVGEIPSLVAALGDDLPDLIVAGHRHAWMIGRVRGVPIVSSDQHGVGVARTRFCVVDGKAKLRSIERRVLFAGESPKTPLGEKVAQTIAPFIAKVKAEADAPVTTLAATCAHQAIDGTAYAEQIARAVALHVADAKAPPPNVPVVALVNAGGLRAPLLQGAVTFKDLFAAFPFENAVAACATTKAGLARMIDNAFKRPSSKERFPLGISGAKLFVRREADGTPTRTKLEIPGQNANADDAPVWVAIPDFLLWGGDGILEGVTCSTTATSSTRVRDAWREVLTREHGGCDGAPKNVVVEQ